MATYIVNYDLIGKKDYTRLYEYLRSYGTRCRPLESLWVIVTDKTAETIRNDINAYIDSDDKILVLKSSGVGAWNHLPKETSDWLIKWL